MKPTTTLSLTRKEREMPARRLTLVDPDRPRTRGDCVGGERPCPYVSCRHHLLLDVNENTGGIRANNGLELEELSETCALDVADRGGATLEEVSQLMKVSRERVRQIEANGLRKLGRMVLVKEMGK
jgi:hypothetical protein